MVHVAKGKEARRTRRERALSRRRGELEKWIMGVNADDQKEKIDRATKDVENLENRIGRVVKKG